MLAGDMLSVKSFCDIGVKVKVTVAVCVRLAEAAVIVTAYAAGVAEVHDSKAVEGEGGRVTLVGFKVWHVSPVGSGLSDSETVPVKPFWAVIVIVEVADVPTGTDDGDVAVIVKVARMPVTVAAVAVELPE